MIASVAFTLVDYAVVVGYFIGILSLGLFFWRRNNSADQFTAGGRSLPGWLCGLSIFATYLSSISYLALPGKAFVDNWNVFMFSVALPPAAAIAVYYFLPLYRRSGEVSAYSLLENRFGLWARLYASGFYLLFQIARIGVVMYLMALPMAVLFGWDIRVVILVTGVVVTLYSFIGGILAVIWADAIQAIVLMAGALLALTVLLSTMPGGPAEVFRVASAADKFSLGDPSPWSFGKSTIWVVLLYGLFDNLRNFGIDQSYVQRYIASTSDREAAKSVWFGALLYVPVSALFLFIGTSLYAYYEASPADTDAVKRLVAEGRLMSTDLAYDSAEYVAKRDRIEDSLEPVDLGDRIFPHFIATHLPTGVRGLLIAAIFAAAMSTVSTSLNSAATLVMSDFYRRLIRPQCTDRQQVAVLRGSTVAWGAMGTAMALVLVRMTDSVLDVWWGISSVLGAAILGLFLVGLLARRLAGPGAMIAIAVGMLVIAWMVLSQSRYWPPALSSYANPMHHLLVIVVGPSVIVALGWLLSFITPTTVEKTS